MKGKMKCSWCKKAANEVCKACRVAAYCSEKCHVQHWEQTHHAGECLLMRAFMEDAMMLFGNGAGMPSRKRKKTQDEDDGGPSKRQKTQDDPLVGLTGWWDTIIRSLFGDDKTSPGEEETEKLLVEQVVMQLPDLLERIFSFLNARDIWKALLVNSVWRRVILRGWFRFSEKLTDKIFDVLPVVDTYTEDADDWLWPDESDDEVTTLGLRVMNLILTGGMPGRKKALDLLAKYMNYEYRYSLRYHSDLLDAENFWPTIYMILNYEEPEEKDLYSRLLKVSTSAIFQYPVLATIFLENLSSNNELEILRINLIHKQTDFVRLSKALETNSTVTLLDFYWWGDINESQERNVIKPFADMLEKNSTITDLRLTLRYPHPDAHLLGEALAKNSTITRLHLEIRSSVRIDGLLRGLGKALESNSTLKTLNLELAIDDIQLTTGYQSDSFMPREEWDDEFKAFATGLGLNYGLDKLEIRFDRSMNNQKAIFLANAISVNQGLKTLKLAGYFTDISQLEYIISALDDNLTLTLVDVSYVYGLDDVITAHPRDAFTQLVHNTMGKRPSLVIEY
jgi:hypothetical protein